MSETLTQTSASTENMFLVLETSFLVGIAEKENWSIVITCEFQTRRDVMSYPTKREHRGKVAGAFQVGFMPEIGKKEMKS